MWLSFVFFLLLVVVVIGGVLLGGVFTIVLVPIAVLVVVAAIGYGMWARSAGAKTTSEEGPGDPLPHSGHRNTAPRPATPDELVDARRQQ